MAKRQITQGGYEISGPGADSKFAPCPGSAVAYATAKAGATGRTWYVRDPLGSVIFMAERDDAGVARLAAVEA